MIMLDPAVLDDYYSIAIARNIRDDDIIHVGASQIDVWRAVEVARLLHAPRARVVAGGTFHLNYRNFDMSLLSSRTYGRDLMALREATLMQTHVFNDLHRGRVSFPSAIEIDRTGNGNLIGITAKGRKIRGPGSAGLSTLTSFADRFYFTLKKHSPQTLVDKVANISVLGDPETREKLGYAPDALAEIITPLATFRQSRNGLQLSAVTPGLSSAFVAEQTGFAIETTADIATRSPITPAERAALDAIPLAPRR